MDAFVCPKPIRIGQLAGIPDLTGSIRTGVDFLDLFLTMGGENQVDLDPFFCGSPPTRSANPLVNDARFGEAAPVNDFEANSNLATVPDMPFVPVPVPASGRTGFARSTFGFAPAKVRIEGFDCLDRERGRRRGISAMA